MTDSSICMQKLAIVCHTLPLVEVKIKCQYTQDRKPATAVMVPTAAHDSSPAWVANPSPCGTPIPQTPAGLSPRTRRISMKEDARKNRQRRKRQKRSLARRKHIAEKNSKAQVA